MRETLKWAIQLARTPDLVKDRCTGLAAYDEWAEALLRDDDFPADDLDTLTVRCRDSNSVTLSGLREARQMAAKFLNDFVHIEPSVAGVLQAAANLYEQEVAILLEAQSKAPFCFAPEEKRLQMADPKLRRKLAKLIIEAKSTDEKGVASLERALKIL